MAVDPGAALPGAPALLHILELLEQGQPLQAQALTVQSMKATHQCVLNNGNWKLGWPLTGLQDPLARRKFAGSATELELMANFVHAKEEVVNKIFAKSHRFPKCCRLDRHGDSAKLCLFECLGKQLGFELGRQSKISLRSSFLSCLYSFVQAFGRLYLPLRGPKTRRGNLAIY